MDAEIVILALSLALSALTAAAAGVVFVRRMQRTPQQLTREEITRLLEAGVPAGSYVTHDDGLPDFAAMSIDELADWKKQHKFAGLAAGDPRWRRDVQIANAVQNNKIADLHLNEARYQIARRAAREGKTDDEIAREWLSTTDLSNLGRIVQARLYFGFPRVGREPPGWDADVSLRQLGK